MRWQPRRHLPLVVALAVLIAAVGLVLPWWSIELGSSESNVAPFAPGAADGVVSEGAVTAVGVLVLVGLVGFVGGLVLWLRERGGADDDMDPAAWIWLGSGGFLLVAALTAVITWPSEDFSFWDSIEAGGTAIQSSAAIGWYLTLVAGAIGAVAGMAWLVRQEDAEDEGGGEDLQV